MYDINQGVLKFEKSHYPVSFVCLSAWNELANELTLLMTFITSYLEQRLDNIVGMEKI